MLLVNPAMRETLGLPADAEGRAALELIRNADLPSILEGAHSARGPVTGEIETTGPRSRRLLVHAAPLPMVNGKHQGLLVVFVDVTADWCLTCKVNKLLVIERDPVAAALGEAGVAPLLADWTNPDQAIADYLAAHGRYGIPFNAVYGPGAPDGILLPELLSTETVLDALKQARGASS